MKTSLLLATVFLFMSAAQASEVKYPLNGGQGSISGIITPQNKFRISEIHEIGTRNLKITGDLFKGQSTEDILGECDQIYGNSLSVLKKEKKSVGLSMTLYPYTSAGLSKILGVEVETAPALIKLSPVLRLNTKNYTRRSIPMVRGEDLAERLFGNSVVRLESVAQGEEVKIDLTGYGALVCDLVMGTAELSWKALVKFPLPLPEKFVPLDAQDIQRISQNLLTTQSYEGGALGNIIKITAEVVLDLEARNIKVDRTSEDPQALRWTGRTLEKLVEGLMDPKTGKPQYMTYEKAKALENQLSVTAYQFERRELLWTAKLTGEIK